MGEEPTGVEDDLLDAHLFQIEFVPAELEEITQFLENEQAPKGMNTKKKSNSSKVAPYSVSFSTLR